MNNGNDMKLRYEGYKGHSEEGGKIYPICFPPPALLFQEPNIACMTIRAMESGSVQDAPLKAIANWAKGTSSSIILTCLYQRISFFGQIKLFIERNEDSKYIFFLYLRTSKNCWLLCNQLSSCGWLCWQLREQFLYLLNEILMLNSSRSSNNLKEIVASFDWQPVPNEVLNKYLDWEEKWEKNTTQSLSKGSTMNKKMKPYSLMWS